MRPGLPCTSGPTGAGTATSAARARGPAWAEGAPSPRTGRSFLRSAGTLRAGQGGLVVHFEDAWLILWPISILEVRNSFSIIRNTKKNKSSLDVCVLEYRCEKLKYLWLSLLSPNHSPSKTLFIRSTVLLSWPPSRAG